MGNPIAVPRSQAFQDRAQSCTVILTRPLIARTPGPPSGPCAATNSASPSANIATASVVTSMPSRSCGTPKARRVCPVNWSMPTMASARPMNSDTSPRKALSPKAADTVTKASTISAKYSRGPKTSASFTTCGARKASISVAISPATKDPMAAVASAGPPRPARAILLPSSAVMTDALSPGVFNRIDVVDPPYMPP